MCLRSISALLACAFVAIAAPARAQDEATWTEIRPNLVGEQPLEDGTGIVDLVAPKRAEDAAIVSVEIRLSAPPGDPSRFAKLWVVVDENPAPLAGLFAFDEPKQTFSLSLRVRVNSYSFLRAIAETADGRRFMTKTYVKAAGGCSAPASKDPAEALANLGQMRFRTFPDRGEAQVQVRHPNYSGLQMDQVTRLYTPAWYVEALTVSQGTTPLFSMTGGISVSEDPTFRFSFKPNGEPVTVEAKDTQGRVFRHVFPQNAS